MKKLLAIVLSFALLSPAFAFDTAKIRMKISGIIPDNTHFLCVGHAGCRNMQSIKGKEFSMDTGSIDNIAVLDIHSRQLHVQKIPESCNISVAKDQTLVVSGQLVRNKNKVLINNLRCAAA